nr:hypothetical protein CFP56_78359 [Quercus suber]
MKQFRVGWRTEFAMSYCPMKLKLFSAFPLANADLKILLFGKRRRMEFTLQEVHIGCFQKLRPCPNQANQIQQQIMDLEENMEPQCP